MTDHSEDQRRGGQTRREPPVEAIKGGYWITQARRLLRGDDKFAKADDEHAYMFMVEGLRYLEKAIDIVAEQTHMFIMQPGHGMEKLYAAAEELQAVKGRIPLMQRRRLCWAIAAGHDHLRLMMRDLGYRTITNEDFQQFGDGGGR